MQIPKLYHTSEAIVQANAMLLEIKGFDVKLRKNNVNLNLMRAIRIQLLGIYIYVGMLFYALICIP